MKKQFIFLVTIISPINGLAQHGSSGQLKITLVSAKCINKSWDGFVEFDGHGNEIAVASSFVIYDAANPSIIKSGSDGTVLYGSGINGMTKAGTETPDLGGITIGDEIQINKILLNEHINANDNILFSPALWERDGPEKNTINSYNAQLQTDLMWASNHNPPFPISDVRNTSRYEDRALFCLDIVGYGPQTKYQDISKNFVCSSNAQGNRVVGIASYSNDCKVLYSPRLLVLDARLVTQVSIYNKIIRNSNYHDRPDYIPETLIISFKEETYADKSYNSNYIITLKVEFTPDEVALNNSIQIQPRNTQLKQNITIKNATDFKLFSVVGKWTGTQTNVDGLYLQAISFELTNNVELIMGNTNTGAVSVKGNYTYTNGNITGSYTLTGSTDAILFTGSVNPTTLVLTLNLGAEGKLIMNKN